MPCLGAEMRNIDDGGRVVSQKTDDLTLFKALHAFAGAKDGQGAQEPEGVNFEIGFHERQNMEASQGLPRECYVGHRDVACLIG